VIEALTDPGLLTEFLSTTVRLSVPLVYAALGGLLSERSGVFNIALEGKILAGAFGAAVGAFFLDGAAGGLLVGMLVGLGIGVFLAALGVTLAVNQIVAGIAINLFVVGLTSFLSRVVFGAQANTLQLPGLEPIAIPGLAAIPIVGEAFFNKDLLVYALYVLVPFMYVFVFHTPWGLAIRAAGQHPAAADTAGIPVVRLRFLCVSAAGVLAAIGGCYLVLVQVHLFSENMSAGKGFIALAAVILGRWNPVGALLACLLFGFFDALQLRLQFANPEVPYQFFVLLPYLVSILALVGLVGRPRPPAAIGQPYKREAKS